MKIQGNICRGLALGLHSHGGVGKQPGPLSLALSHHTLVNVVVVNVEVERV